MHCAAEEALTWVENLHGGVGVRMLFMDHLSADLLREDLPWDTEGIRVINICEGLSNNRETNHTVEARGCGYVTRSHIMLLNNCHIGFMYACDGTQYIG